MLPRSILRGYDKYTEKIIARALGIPLKTHSKGGEHRRMKIPMGALKKDAGSNDKPKDKKKVSGMKFGAMKGKKKSDNDVDD